jgi:hypothetical protein
VLDDRPIIGRQRHNRQTTAGEVLLVDEALVARDKNVKAIFFCRSKQFAVFNSAHPM